MEILYVVLSACFITFFELAIVSTFFPIKFDLKFVDNLSIAVIYKKYFLLPFTTKKIHYKNLQKAFIRSRVVRTKTSSYTVYDLMLQFPKKNKILFSGEKKEVDLIKYCDKINDSIRAFEYCEISKDNKNKTIGLFLLLFLTPFFILIPSKYSKNNYITDITDNFYIVVIASGILSVFFLLSFIVNIFVNVLNKNINKINIDYNKKENVDIDSEAKRINDSLIK